ncbi:hypothetical protein L1987_57206 [Smallanthus sonchifolius]|uniref:Uncharacterized protein n=1 Tax=Smallanthus sonchifolius TaxID=185202 RepID=A0ACB9DCF8_9ASTR|nr:hypothetical protein L1987_57206 [Smallanthus sonchifolius]
MPEIETVPEITTVNEPLLSPTQGAVPAPSAGGDRTSTRVPMLLGRFSGRRGAPLIVRENVALQMQDCQEDWSYSFPVVVIDALWNLAFVVVALAMLFWTAREETNLKLRVWICGYATKCVVNVVLLVVEYKRRNRRISTAVMVPISLTSSSSSSEDGGDDVNPIRLTLAFLAIDVFFLAIRSIILCLLSAGYCFCLPCIIAFMYYISNQDPASDADISRLPKYIFEVDNGDMEQPDVRACRMIPMRRNGPDFSTERVLLTKDASIPISPQTFVYVDLHLRIASLLDFSERK